MHWPDTRETTSPSQPDHCQLPCSLNATCTLLCQYHAVVKCDKAQIVDTLRLLGYAAQPNSIPYTFHEICTQGRLHYNAVPNAIRVQ